MLNAPTLPRMAPAEPGDITTLLKAAVAGNRKSESILLEKVNGKLRRIAKREIDKLSATRKIDCTELITDAFMQLFRKPRGRKPQARKPLDLKSRTHFYAVAAKTMYGIVIDKWRRENAVRRGGKYAHVNIDKIAIAAPEGMDEYDDIGGLGDGLEGLRAAYPRTFAIVRLRYFSPLTNAEIAEHLSTSIKTVERELRFGRANLRKRLDPKRSEALEGGNG